MIKKRTKFISTILASACGLAVMAGGTLLGAKSASAASGTTYLAGDIFTTSNASIDVSKEAVQFTFKDVSSVGSDMKDKGTVTYSKRSVALAWKEEVEEGGDTVIKDKYFSTKFSLVDTDSAEGIDFEELAMVMESKPATATKDEKTVNKVVFKKEGAEVKVAVNPESAKDEEDVTWFDIVETSSIELAFDKEGCATGEFRVVLKQANAGDQELGKFTNIAGNLAKYVAGKISPLSFEMKLPARAEGSTALPYAKIQLEELNGQSFYLDEDDHIVDTAKPVAVVGQEISALQLGKAYSLDVEVVDVLDDFLSVTKQFYQFNPNDFADGKLKVVEGKSKDDDYFRTLASSTTFKEMQYTEDGKTYTVFNNYQFDKDVDGTPVTVKGKEYVAIRYILEDNVTGKVYVDLSWYAADEAREILPDVKYMDGTTAISFISMDKSKVGPQFTFLETGTKDNKSINQFKFADVDGNKGVNTYNYDELIENYQALVEEAAEDLYVGSSASAYIYLPSLEGLIADNDGYQNLQFAISYKKQGSTTNSSVTGLDFNAIKFSVSEVGMYEFKIYATDSAENKMKYYDKHGELVTLNSENVWELKAQKIVEWDATENKYVTEEVDAIPSFHFTAKPTPMKVETEKEADRKVNKVLDDTFSLGSFQILGVEGELKKQYGLYRVNASAVNNKLGTQISDKDLYSITYDDLTSKAQGKTGNLAPEDEVEFFLEIYVECLAEKLSISKDALWQHKDIFFTRIEAYNDRINETDHADEFAKNNKFYWRPDSGQSFETVEEGTYLVLASFTNPEVNAIKAAAYKIVIVQEESDELPGESDWLKNNLAAVVLFSVAGVMLILIIVLLFIKTDDKTLDDVDEELDGAADDKKKKKEKKAKKSEEEKLAELDEVAEKPKKVKKAKKVEAPKEDVQPEAEVQPEGEENQD